VFQIGSHPPERAAAGLVDQPPNVIFWTPWMKRSKD